MRQGERSLHCRCRVAGSTIGLVAWALGAVLAGAIAWGQETPVATPTEVERSAEGAAAQAAETTAQDGASEAPPDAPATATERTPNDSPSVTDTPRESGTPLEPSPTMPAPEPEPLATALPPLAATPKIEAEPATTPPATAATTAACAPAPARTRRRGVRGSTAVMGATLAAAGGGTLGYLRAAGEKADSVVKEWPADSDARRRDDDGDGYSEAQGDCNDNNRLVGPHGSVFVSGAYSPLAGQTVNCRTRDAVTIVLTNQTCQPVTVSGISYEHHILSGYCTAANGSLAVATTRVGSGEIATIANRAPVGPTTGMGCCRGACTGGTCGFGMYPRVVTSAGTFTSAGYSYRMVYSGCAQCLSARGQGIGEQAGCEAAEE